MKKSLKLISASVFLVFLIYISVQLFVPSNIGNTQLEIEVPEGATYKQAITILTKNKLLRDKNLFLIIGKVMGLDKKIRAGYYSFWGNMSPLQVFKRLKDGKIIENELTIVEGDSLIEIGEKLESNRIMTSDVFNALVRDRDFIASLNVDAPSLEGYIFPQTYRFPKGARPDSILRLMVNKMRDEFSEDLRVRAKEIGFGEREVLTLASIIEREAATDQERYLISAVYHNRLKKRMPLQADPTAIYGIKNYKQKITRNDLKNRSRYNTYMINGLPPGPIASPGIKSIIAALYPADVPYLYFVSRGDGTHIFSRTLTEHNNAIKLARSMQEASASSDNHDSVNANGEKIRND